MTEAEKRVEEAWEELYCTRMHGTRTTAVLGVQVWAHEVEEGECAARALADALAALRREREEEP
jgi:methionine salvage enolase-phosphatase E1